MRKIFCTIVLAIMFISLTEAQIGFGTVAGLDLYQYHRVPDYRNAQGKLVKGHSLGSAVANFVYGPKLWIGGNSFSVSIQGAVAFAPFAFDTDDFKGMGAVSFPLSVDLNFLGLSGFSPTVRGGFSLGVGMSYHRTELFFVDDTYKAERPSGFYQNYFAQVAYGVGSGGTDFRLYVRYGQGDNSSRFISTGLSFSTNYFTGKKEPLGE